MNAPLHIRGLRIHRLQIPMRFSFEHASASRSVADPVVLEVSAGAPYAHHVGYGETLARPYVTGETADSVAEDITRVFVPRLAEFHPKSFIEALEFIEALPSHAEDRVILAARAAVELALLDLVCRVHRRRPAEIAGWMGLAGFGPPGCIESVRYSGMVVGRTKTKLQAGLWLQRLYGLRDFKLKVAVKGWEQRLALASAVLGRGIAKHRLTLRVDANAGWSLGEVLKAAPVLIRYGVCALEQPLPDEQDAELRYIATQSPFDLIADESLLSADDAQRLIRGGGVRVLNVRVAKNGGLMPALRIARLALSAGLDVQLGCLVGETSILSAVGLAFLEACPQVRFLEGAYSPFLLRRDIARDPIRVPRGGRPQMRVGFGWGIEVNPTALEELCPSRPATVLI